MPAFVQTIVDAISSTTVNFLEDAVTTYWGTLLGIGLVLTIGFYFLRLARFGRGR